MKPTFSIVTITYNRAHLIKETIQSVLNQTYQNFEHIIIDDGSTDNTEEIIADFNDKRIKYFKYPKSGILSYLRNEGVKKTKGELVAILDSDDIWRSDKLQVVKDVFLGNEDVLFVIHNASFIRNNINENIGYLNFKTDFYKNILNDLFSDTILAYPIYTFRKSLIQTIGCFDESMVDGQHDFYLRAASKHPIYFIAGNLTFIKKHKRNHSAKFDVFGFKEYFESLDKLFNNKSISKITYKKVKSIVNFRLGMSSEKLNIKSKVKKEYFLKSLVLNPLSYIGLKSIYYYFKTTNASIKKNK